jgi:hypothetical protein
MKKQRLAALYRDVHRAALKPSLAQWFPPRSAYNRIEVSMKSISMNVFRFGVLLILVGFFAPISCSSNGHQIAQGIMGNGDQAGNVIFLSSIEDFYGYFMYGVLVFAIAGLILTLVDDANHGFLLRSLCLAMSLALLMAVFLRLRTFRNTGLLGFALETLHYKLELLIGGYLIIAGYLISAAGSVFKIVKKR